jgi:hypothetical protein
MSIPSKMTAEGVSRVVAFHDPVLVKLFGIEDT